MSQIMSLLRAATTRRPLPDAVVAPAAFTTPATTRPLGANQPARRAARPERLPAPAVYALGDSTFTPPPRPASDFTARVMARVTTPPPEPDPREARARRTRGHLRRATKVYLALLTLSGATLVALAFVAPWLLVGAVAAIVSLALLAAALAALISAATGGAISGFGVAYLAMLAALTPPLLLLARRAGRRAGRRASPTRRRL